MATIHEHPTHTVVVEATNEATTITSIVEHPPQSVVQETINETVDCVAMATSSQTVELKVAMSCNGCVGAVKRVLGKLEGVETYDIDLDAQKVTVKGTLSPEEVLSSVSKTGKATTYWPGDDKAEKEAKVEK